MTDLTNTFSASSEAANTIAAVVESRRTINFFKTEMPPRETIERAIDLARWAPNHHLTEPWHFYHLSDEAKGAVVDLNTEIVRARRDDDAAQKKHKRWSAIPGWIAVTCDKSQDEHTFMEDYAAVACTIQNLSLYLWASGIGTKWTTGPVTKDPRFYEIIWADPERETLVGLVWYGYADEVPVSTRKPLEQVLVDV